MNGEYFNDDDDSYIDDFNNYDQQLNTQFDNRVKQYIVIFTMDSYYNICSKGNYLI